MFLELVKKRRSVRRYLDRVVERDKIGLCLEAARLAPSACNAQPWKFIVVDEAEQRARLCRAAFSGLYSTNKFARQAPVIIVVLVQAGKWLPRLAGKLQGKFYPLIDLGIACEHLILQAAELNLGTCWLGWFNAKKVSKILKLPRKEKPAVLISLGYPAPGDKIPPVKKSLGELVTFNPPI